jgi:hypothetical protein
MSSPSIEKNKKHKRLPFERKRREIKDNKNNNSSNSTNNNSTTKKRLKPNVDDNGIEIVEKTGTYGSYGRSDGAMSIEDDEWATSQRAWIAISPYLKKFHNQKIWMPFYYDGSAGERLKNAGFNKVIHRKEDFFSKINDKTFTKNFGCVIDNPPYTGKGMKEKVLQSLVDADIPFCLLLPLGVLHSQMVRDILKKEKVQVIIPRKVWVSKTNQAEIPFKYLCWLCYGLKLERDLYLMDEE